MGNYFFSVVFAAFTIWTTLQGTVFSASIKDGVRESRQISNGSTNATYEYGVGCGTIRVHPNYVIQIQSTNFGIGKYYNNDACTWTFTSDSCALSVYCPCFDIPSSLGCLEDYLKIGHLHFHDKFCGDNTPIGIYRATTDFLTLRFRSDYKGSGGGFLCYVRCTATGLADPIAPNVTCPNNTRNPYGNPVF
ncbi:hypothetical protein Ocin01_15426 [Orchesella cincta]|uniref:CUB domain-containing protein n=1 Tax=Orchesella cincta TaxID=48709 RepID=A0A1D2ME05_ORCCI|nr:hypothetical protein Ocin01_15426 [Orchesella cincta]